MNDVNTILKQTIKTFVALVNNSFFKYQVSSYPFFEQERYDARSD